MKTPVLIPARNEAEHIGRTLKGLPTDVEPIVIPNGCTDETETIVEQIGATIIRSSSEGKLPSIQAGLQYLGKGALEPLIILDADTVPLFPRQWLTHMLKAASSAGEEQPTVVSGAVIYVGINPILAAWRNAGHWRNLIRTRSEQDQGVTGGNMLLSLQDPEALDHILALPNYWPRDDTAIRDAILSEKGRSVKSLHPATTALTAGDRFPSLCERLRIGHDQTWKGILQTYLDEAPPGSLPYADEVSSQNAQFKAHALS